MLGRDLGRSSSLDRQRPRKGKRSETSPWIRNLAKGLLLVALAVGMFRFVRGTTDKITLSRQPASASAPITAASNGSIESAYNHDDIGESLEDAILYDHSGAPAEEVTAVVRFGPVSPFYRIAAQLMSGQTLVQSLINGGAPRSEANRIIYALEKHVDFRRLRPGDRFEGMLWLGEHLIEGTFYHGRLDRYRVKSIDGDLSAKPDPISLETQIKVVEGSIQSSLFEAIYAAGERPALIMSFVDLFSWDFDFNVSTRAGDTFKMLVEKRYIEDDFYSYGSILAGRFASGNQIYEACWYDSDEKSNLAGYYHTDGSSVKGAFLRAPVKYSRISSRFTLRRFHPVLKVNRPHRGIDYAAPMGTPVYAVSSGLVIDARWMGGAGRAVRVKHPNGWITSYSHLSKISVKKGQRLKQGQLVGKVGSSGHSTGPHLDYRVKIGGKFVNPLKLKYPRGKSVPRSELARFKTQCNHQLATLDGVVDVAVLENSQK